MIAACHPADKTARAQILEKQKSRIIQINFRVS